MNLQHIPPILLSTLISTLIRLVESERGTRNPITLRTSAHSASFFSSSPLSSSSSHWLPALPPRPSSVCFTSLSFLIWTVMTGTLFNSNSGCNCPATAFTLKDEHGLVSDFGPPHLRSTRPSSSAF